MKTQEQKQNQQPATVEPTATGGNNNNTCNMYKWNVRIPYINSNNNYNNKHQLTSIPSNNVESKTATN
jgi:hypothetical protein